MRQHIFFKETKAAALQLRSPAGCGGDCNEFREVSLGYSLPKKLFSNSFGKVVKGIDISLVGRNLAILHKNLPYADPEDSFGSGNLQGFQTGSYPAVRNIAFNLKIKL